MGSLEAGLCCRKGVVPCARGFWGLPRGVAAMCGAALPSAGCTNTLRCKPQTASEVLKKGKTEPNLVPSSLGCSGKAPEGSRGDSGSATHQSQHRGHLPSATGLWRGPFQAFLGHSQRFSDGTEVSGRLAAFWKVSEPWNPLGTQSFGHSRFYRCQLCPCLCLQGPVLNPKDRFCGA